MSDGAGDTRLRAAVAAWVRSGDTEEQSDEEPKATEPTADEDAPKAEPAPTDDKADEEAPSARGNEDAPKSESASGDEPAAADGEDAPKGASVRDDEPAAADGEDAPKGASVRDDESAPADGEDAPKGASVRDDESAAADGVDAPQGPPAADDASRTGGAGGSTAQRHAPAAADGVDAPQGPPAADDASRTGGADGSTAQPHTPAPADHAPPRDQPVDQPTAVFKRPKPQVDQPTTMLKIGDVPRDTPTPKDAPKTAPESPSERTSKFVALKPLDDPATRKPAKPAQQPADATTPVPAVGPERTTQQPLPPKPPLDLLAELTNTPPPPDTPVRTLVRRIKIWTPLVLLLAVVFAIVQAVRPLPTPGLTLTAEESYTFDGTKPDLPWPAEGQGWLDVNGIGTMGDFGRQTPVAIGSVAKAMTAYIVLKDHPMKSGEDGEKITVDALAEKEGGYDKDGESTLNTVKKGDVLTEKQALSAIMIPSANNIARLLARWDAGSEAAFIKKMNDTAKELGMTDTTYTDASGLKETTVSTAHDQVKLGNELVKIPALTDITKLPSWKDPSGQTWQNY
ncbi:D-alanyl-D-alanine carboxypeptidase family protein, partial [Streptomyces sp. 7R007]